MSTEPKDYSIVIEAIKNHFPPDQAAAILNAQMGQEGFISWSSVSGCWLFNWQGIFYGIETDGYLHS